MAAETEDYVLEISRIPPEDDSTIELWAEVQFQDFRIAASGKLAVNIRTGDFDLDNSELGTWLAKHPSTDAELREAVQELRLDELQSA